MKTIVCYGDSNTWGFMPMAELPDWTRNRFDFGTRWTGVLQKALGSEYRVEEEGLNGRTTMFDDVLDERRNGLKYIDICMLTKMPVDLVILMLGTNDVKEHFGATAYLIARGVGRLAERIRAGGYGFGGKCPEILVMAPAHLGTGIVDAWLGQEFGPHCLEKDARLAELYEALARENGLHFLNAAEVAEVSPADCVHLSAEAHRRLGARVAEEVRQILG